MNSWSSSGFCAWAPPFTTLKWGTGSLSRLSSGASQRYNGLSSASAMARAAAIETPTVALAPRRLLVSVPSSSITARSSSSRLFQARPARRPLISPLTLPTALVTPAPL